MRGMRKIRGRASLLHVGKLSFCYCEACCLLVTSPTKLFSLDFAS